MIRMIRRSSQTIAKTPPSASTRLDVSTSRANAPESRKGTPTRSTTISRPPSPTIRPSSSRRPGTVTTSSSPATVTTWAPPPRYADVSVKSSDTQSTYPGPSQCRLSGLCRSTHTDSHGDELVADPADGQDPLRLVRRLLDLAPEVRDVDVARTLVADVRALPEMLHDLAPAVGALRLLGEQRQQPELRGRQLDFAASERDLVPGQVERERSHPLEGVASPGPIELSASEQGAHAADELGDRERLRDVVVGADLETEYAVDLGILCGQHHDRDVAFGAQPPTDLGA